MSVTKTQVKIKVGLFYFLNTMIFIKMATLPKMSPAGNTPFSIMAFTTISLNKWTHKFLITGTYALKVKIPPVLYTFATNRIEKQSFNKRSCQAVHFFLHLRPVVLTQKASSPTLCICEVISDSKENKVGFLPLQHVFYLQEVTVPKNVGSS